MPELYNNRTPDDIVGKIPPWISGKGNIIMFSILVFSAAVPLNCTSFKVFSVMIITLFPNPTSLLIFTLITFLLEFAKLHKIIDIEVQMYLFFLFC